MATATDYQNLILSEVGAGLDADNTDSLKASLPALWDMYNYKAYYPQLQYLYVKRHALKIIIGPLRVKINKTLGPQTKQMAQYFSQCQTLYEACDAEIKVLEKQATSERSPSVDRSDVISPEGKQSNSFPYNPNPSDPRYRGDISRRKPTCR